MDKLETNFIKTQTLRHLVWFRYIDDFFFSWTHGEGNLKRFLDNLNIFDPHKKFTHEYSKKETPFLDLKLGIKNVNIATDLFVKDTGRHQYLHYTSTRPYHTKRSVVFSQTLLLSCLCAFEKDLRDA